MTTLRIFAGLAAAALLGAAVLPGRVRPAAPSPAEPPARSSFAPMLIEKGASLAAIGNCKECHTALGGKPLK